MRTIEKYDMRPKNIQADVLDKYEQIKQSNQKADIERPV